MEQWLTIYFSRLEKSFYNKQSYLSIVLYLILSFTQIKKEENNKERNCLVNPIKKHHKGGRKKYFYFTSDIQISSFLGNQKRGVCCDSTKTIPTRSA